MKTEKGSEKMAYDNRSGYNNRYNQGNYGNRPGNAQPRETVKPAEPMPLPKDFVDAAFLKINDSMGDESSYSIFNPF